MAYWIRCDSPSSAKALLILIASGSFDSGSHPPCSLSQLRPDTVDVDLGPNPDPYLELIRQCTQVVKVGPIDVPIVLPDLWANRDALVQWAMSM
jgi:hypothetical protein